MHIDDFMIFMGELVDQKKDIQLLREMASTPDFDEMMESMEIIVVRLGKMKALTEKLDEYRYCFETLKEVKERIDKAQISPADVRDLLKSCTKFIEGESSEGKV